MRGAGVIAMLALLLLVAAGARADDDAGVNEDIDEHALFQAVGRMYAIDPDLLEAIARVESAGRVDAVSPKGAEGLMQLMPATAATYRVNDRKDAVENVLGAARFLTHLRETPLSQNPNDQDSLANVLAAYNAGEGAVWRYNGIPPYLETREYVGQVLWFYLQGTQLPPPRRVRTVPKAVVQAPKPRPLSDETSALEEMDSIRAARAAASNTEPAAGAHLQ